MSENAVFAGAGRNAENGFPVDSEIGVLVKHRAIILSAIGASKRRVFCAKLIRVWIDTDVGEKLRDLTRKS
jgi:hypothetical protein